MPLVVFMVSMPDDATLTASDVVLNSWTQTNCIIAECVTGGIGSQEQVLYRSCYHDPVTYVYDRKKGSSFTGQPAIKIAPIIYISKQWIAVNYKDHRNEIVFTACDFDLPKTCQ